MYRHKPEIDGTLRRRLFTLYGLTLPVFALLASLLVRSAASPQANAVAVGAQARTPMVVLGYNDLGMHCINQDFSEIVILPPFNNLHAQVIDRSGEDPRIVTSGVTIHYSIPNNTHSADKTNFWQYVQAAFGVALPLNIGLTGNGLAGTMRPTGKGDWSATGIPITQIDDFGANNPYQLAAVSVTKNGSVVATTRPVVPVSWEMSCNLCHTTPGISVATDILRAHDRLHGTTLERQKPVLCARCHADPALNMSGKPGVSTLSHAMHSTHAPYMSRLHVQNACYACHPGFKTQCLRDVHYSKGMTCTSCHGSMAAVGNPNRRPWIDEPRCGNCHKRAGFEFEQPNTLYRDSKGHHGVMCEACHGSPHAITPTVTAADNIQAISLQGHAGTINDCRVCHRSQPDDSFPHRLSGD